MQVSLRCGSARWGHRSLGGDPFCVITLVRSGHVRVPEGERFMCQHEISLRCDLSLILKQLTFN